MSRYLQNQHYWERHGRQFLFERRHPLRDRKDSQGRTQGIDAFVCSIDGEGSAPRLSRSKIHGRERDRQLFVPTQKAMCPAGNNHHAHTRGPCTVWIRGRKCRDYLSLSSVPATLQGSKCNWPHNIKSTRTSAQEHRRFTMPQAKAY